MCLIW